MAVDSIIAQIDAEILRLTQARILLVGLGSTTALNSIRAVGKIKKRKKRVLSPEARKRIADAQHRRWAAHKAKSKSKSK